MCRRATRKWMRHDVGKKGHISSTRAPRVTAERHAPTRVVAARARHERLHLVVGSCTRSHACLANFARGPRGGEVPRGPRGTPSLGGVDPTPDRWDPTPDRCGAAAGLFKNPLAVVRRQLQPQIRTWVGSTPPSECPPQGEVTPAGRARSREVTACGGGTLNVHGGSPAGSLADRCHHAPLIAELLDTN